MFLTSLQQIFLGRFSVLCTFIYAVSFKINRASTAAFTHTTLKLLSTSFPLSIDILLLFFPFAFSSIFETCLYICCPNEMVRRGCGGVIFHLFGFCLFVCLFNLVLLIYRTRGSTDNLGLRNFSLKTDMKCSCGQRLSLRWLNFI